jgi:hypothetical protein
MVFILEIVPAHETTDDDVQSSTALHHVPNDS